MRLYLSRQAANPGRYLLEQSLMLIFGWVPTIGGIAARAAAYRLMLHMDGTAAIERNVRLRFASNIRLGHGSYLDEGVYIHACPGGVEIGANTLVMHGAVLHVYNFRDLPHACIRIGRDSLIGEYSVIRGQGGVTIGDRVYTSPMTQIIAVNHVFDDPTRALHRAGHHRRGHRHRRRRLARLGVCDHRRGVRRQRRGGSSRRGGDEGRPAAHRRRRRAGESDPRGGWQLGTEKRDLLAIIFLMDDIGYFKIRL